MSRTPKWIRRQVNRPMRYTAAQARDLRWLWKHRHTRHWMAEVMAGGIVWRPTPGTRF
jgi:hypothetical protein